MSIQTIKGRVQNKHNTEAEWLKSVYKNGDINQGKVANPFIPLAGELIIYDPSSGSGPRRIKFGDGVNNVVDLPFSTLTPTEVENLLAQLEQSLTIQINDRAPINHSHGNITKEGKIGTAANQAAYTGSGGTLTAGTLPVAAGGTGVTSWTNGSVPIGNSSGGLTQKAATSANTANAIVVRDGNKNFSANVVTTSEVAVGNGDAKIKFDASNNCIRFSFS